ncbi:MAG: hypothetical protein ACXVYC_01435 [Blastococcus sp.]
MSTQTTTRTARRFALTVAVAGIAAFGSVAVAPAAFAADSTDGPAYVIDGNGNGPDSFVVTSTGRIPVFFCEDVKSGKDGAQDPKDVAKAEEKAAKEAQKAADDAAKAEEKAAKEADKADKDAAKTDTKADKVDRVMKQHNICLAVSPTGNRF